MDIIAALKQEESKLHRQLDAVRVAIAALNRGSESPTARRTKTAVTGTHGKRTMSAAVRAKISRTVRARWVKIRAERAAGRKTK
jgi:UDP-N-acetylmuramate-alanine ligase